MNHWGVHSDRIWITACTLQLMNAACIFPLEINFTFCDTPTPKDLMFQKIFCSTKSYLLRHSFQKTSFCYVAQVSPQILWPKLSSFLRLIGTWDCIQFKLFFICMQCWGLKSSLYTCLALPLSFILNLLKYLTFYVPFKKSFSVCATFGSQFSPFPV